MERLTKKGGKVIGSNMCLTPYPHTDIQLIYDKLGQLEDIEEELGIDLKEATELLKWFIDNTMIASELMEFKKSSTHNEKFEGWSHNGYPIQDNEFEKMRDLARAIKYKNGVRH